MRLVVCVHSCHFPYDHEAVFNFCVCISACSVQRVCGCVIVGFLIEHGAVSAASA